MTGERPRLTTHAREQVVRRGLDEQEVLSVAANPEQRFALREGREVRQSRRAEGPVTYLLRVIVDGGDTIVTAYRTSKIDKYWRQS